MVTRIGPFLQELREQHGLSLGRLARVAGVDKSALSRWEAGTRTPRIPELEAVLDALNASSGERSLVLASIDAPRAIRRLKEIGRTAAPGPPPSAGDLMRALRLRRDWSQERLADALGVDRTAIAHWERGERQPANKQMQSLCYALGAAEQEYVALTTWVNWETPSLTVAGTALPFEQRRDDLEHRLKVLSIHAPEGVEDLAYFALEREIWELAAQDDRARAYVFHAHVARNLGRWAAVPLLLRRVRRVATMKEFDQDLSLRMALIAASYAALGGPRPSPQRGMNLLWQWVNHSKLPEYTAWMFSDMADYATKEGRTAEAVSLAERAYRVSQESAYPVERFLRACDLGSHLLRDKRPDDCLALLSKLTPENPQEKANVILLYARAYHQIGNVAEAQGFLHNAFALINAHNLYMVRPTADAVAQYF